MSDDNNKKAAAVLVSEESASHVEDTVKTTTEDGQTTITILRHYCKGCEICAEICPKGVLGMAVALDRWEGSIVEVINMEACNACMLCEYQCPDFGIEVHNVKKEKKKKEKKTIA
ncbi:MAG: 4Fe-4S dicluster domain-containing protein [Calditrichaeota bacterium]|mgnify:CR=1 FL=1|jgi:2-oxoglutarate ferredoxin oxidoreductase subunit delta|nr:4Fe-4S dicluster domain-containing protein [Calditrichota bacterium]MBT7619227.1 4Fe-4S dicluster domain-containing protein [Calditrichota bacterium]MBT7790722.1 4Fe-4S dicluster domain-containing protein [Calditrichota bacterium]